MDFSPEKPAPKAARQRVPGGLRAQLLIALTLICGGLLAALAMIMMRLTQHTMSQTSQEQAHHIAMMALAEMDAQPQGSTFIDRQAQLERLQTHSGMAFMGWRRQKEEVITTEARPLLDHYRTYLAEALPARSPSFQTTTHEGKAYLWTTVYEPNADPDVMIVALPLDALQSSVEQMKRVIGLALALNAALIIILGYATLTYLVVRPLRHIGSATQRAAMGDLASPITHQPANEFGELSRDFNVMLATLAQNRRALEAQLEALAKTHEALKQTQDTLIRAEKLASIGQLAAGIAHEVGNPLAALLGYTELLSEDDGEGLDAEDRADILRRMTAQLERIQRIIRELLDFSRDDAQQPIERTDLGATLQEAISLARATPRGKHATFELPELQPPVMVMAVGSQLLQVLLNLFINALDASAQAETPTITLTIEPAPKDDEDHLLLKVQDNGTGVDEAIMAKLFDPFYTTKEPGKGTGLGLSISLRLMQRIGGDISVEQTERPGACFVLKMRRA